MRRDRPADKDGWTELPSEGRKGPAPKWPLPDPSDAVAEVYAVRTGRALAARELDVWRQIWRTPQAAAWERLGWTLEVALYVRMFAQAELGDMKAVTEVRQMSNNLGLSPAAMMRNRWRVARNQLAERRGVPSAPRVAASGASRGVRDRLKALDGGGA